MKHRIWLGAALSALAFASSVSAEAPTPLYKRADAPVQDRVRDLLGRMTLEEKVAQLQSNSTMPNVPGVAVGPAPASGVVQGGKINEAVARRALGQGMGAFNIIAFGKLSALQRVTQSNLIRIGC